MIRAVLFDLDDTLVDFHPPDRRALFELGAGRVYAFLTARGCSMPAFAPFVARQRRIARRIDFTTWLTGGEPDGRRLLRRLCKDYRLTRRKPRTRRVASIWKQRSQPSERR